MQPIAALAITLIAAALPPPPSGRMHDVSGNPGSIPFWFDKGCETRFKLQLPGAKAVIWSIDWAKVESITVATESSFESDPAADVYKTRTGLVVKGAGAFKVDLDGRTIEADSFEYFLPTASYAGKLQGEWTRRAAACLPPG